MIKFYTLLICLQRELMDYAVQMPLARGINHVVSQSTGSQKSIQIRLTGYLFLDLNLGLIYFAHIFKYRNSKCMLLHLSESYLQITEKGNSK